MMWLINARSYRLEDFSARPKPAYGILSHTWSQHESSFQQFIGCLPRSIQDQKVIQTCRLAIEHGLDYVWIDTCCIDRKSSAELNEAINSMFRWYQDAVICFVYLEDVGREDEIAHGIRKCRWLTRGWTLQELIAPKNIEFYDNQWQLRGNKQDLRRTLAFRAGIPQSVLSGELKLDRYSLSSRMSWASKRQTSRVEDMAYSLLGIFDIHMPVLYGEGMRSFQRLQEKILEIHPDLSILAWDGKDDQQPLCNLLASSPTAFSKSQNDSRSNASDLVQINVTARRLTIDVEDRSVFLMQRNVQAAKDGPRIVLCFMVADTRAEIPLRQISSNLLVRDSHHTCTQNQRSWRHSHARLFTTNSRITLLLSPRPETKELALNRYMFACHLPSDWLEGYEMTHIWPLWSWDDENELVTTARHDSKLTVIVMQSKSEADLMVLMYRDHIIAEPNILLIQSSDILKSKLYLDISEALQSGDVLPWHDWQMRLQPLRSLEFSNTAKAFHIDDLRVQLDTVEVIKSIKSETYQVKHMSNGVEVFKPRLKLVE